MKRVNITLLTFNSGNIDETIVIYLTLYILVHTCKSYSNYSNIVSWTNDTLDVNI